MCFNTFYYSYDSIHDDPCNWNHFLDLQKTPSGPDVRLGSGISVSSSPQNSQSR